MVKAATLEVEIGAKIDQFERSLGKVRKDLGGMEKRLGGVSRGANKASMAFSRMAKRLIAIGLAYFGARGVFKMAKSFLDVATAVEQYEIRLKVLLGSQKAATEAMRDFQGIASKLPFTLEEVIESGIRLTTIKIPFKDWLIPIADVAAAFGMDLPTATDQFSRAMSAGLGAADWFREKGISAMIRDFAKLKFGIEDVSKVGTTILKDVMFEWTKLFKGSTDDMAKTWKGTVSMLQDKWFKFRDAVMKTKVFELMKEGLTGFNEKLDEFVETGKMDEWAKNMAISVIDSFATIAKALMTLSLVFHVYKKAIFEVGKGAAGFFRKAIESTDKLLEKSEEMVALTEHELIWRKRLLGVSKDLATVEGGYQDTIDETVESMANLIEKFEGYILKLQTAKEVVEESKNATEELNAKTKEFGETVVETVIEKVAPAMKEVIKILRAAGVVVKDFVFDIEESWKETFDNIADKVRYFADQVGSIFDQMHANRIQQIENEYTRKKAAIDASMKSDEEKYFAIEKLDREMERRKIAAERAAAARAKAVAFVEAVVYTASAIVKALPDIALAIAVGAIGAIQIGTIAGTPLPSFDMGGFVPKDMIAKVHAGEYIVKAEDVRGAGVGMGMTIHAPITINARTLDDRTIAEAEEKLTRAVQRGIARARGY